MTQDEQHAGNACAGFDAAAIDELRAVAAQYDEAGGLLIKLAGMAGAGAESLLDRLPSNWRTHLDAATGMALTQAYAIAFGTQGDSAPSTLAGKALAWASGSAWHATAAAITGALGGFAGLPGLLIDLPVTTTLILRSIQEVAAEHGEDLADPAVRAHCIAIFGLGGPLAEDDAAEAGFFASRTALTGKAVAEMLRAVLPRFGVMVGEKALAQATPLLGAVAGGVINPVFAGYYRTLAHVHFRLRTLERGHDPDQVRACFERLLAARRAGARAQGPVAIHATRPG